MQQAKPRTRRDKRLHLVYFVDASRTKSLSVSLGALGLLCAGSAAIATVSAASMWYAISQASRMRADAAYIRELKAGLLAQSVTFERILQGNVSQGDKLSLSTKARALEKEIITLLKIPVSSNAPDNEPLDLRKMSNKLSSLNKATINLVAAGAGSDALTPLVDAPTETGGEGLAPSTKPAFLEPVTRADSDAPKSAVAKSTAMPSAKPWGAARAREAGPALVVTFESIRLEAAVTASYDEKDKEPEPDNDTERGSVVSFQVVNSNAIGAQPVWGRVCGIALLDSGFEAQPPNLTVRQASSGQPPPLPGGCENGQAVRFSRMRPTTLRFDAAPKRVRAVALYFSEGTEKAVHSVLWNKPAQ